MMGRNVFAFTKKGIDATPRTTRPTSANSIFVQRFTDNLSAMASKRPANFGTDVLALAYGWDATR